jgi:hypothetical protein
MVNKRIGLITLTLALSFGVGRASASSGDGDVEHDRRTAPPARAIECTAGATFCPAFPTSLRVSRAAFLEQLQHMSGCSDGDEAGREHRLREAGDAASVTTALAHLVLADPSLSLHDVKNAIELIAEPRSENGLQALREVYERSNALVARTIEGGPLSGLDRQEQERYVAKQSEELRRIVVLAVAKDDSAAATSLLRQAVSDEGRSVAIAAARALESRRR